MKISVKRMHFLPTCTVGKLYIDDQDVNIWTLEDVFRQPKEGVIPVEFWKVPGQTAIPTGTYKVIVDYSNRFKKDMPHILDVPGFDGVRIHPGNDSADTEGCILVGTVWHGRDFIGFSRDAFDQLFEKIKSSTDIEIEIS